MNVYSEVLKLLVISMIIQNCGSSIMIEMFKKLRNSNVRSK